MCECKICKRSKKIVDLLSRLKKDDQDFLMALADELDHAEMERDYMASIVDGSWPNADDVIERERKALNVN
jgi:hypothetical protein